MSTEQNKNIFRQMVEDVFNKGNVNMLDRYLADNFVEHEALPPGIPEGREGVKQLTTMLHQGFPDFKATINDLIAEGDKVVCRMTWSGTHQGEFMGIPATGKKVSFEVVDIIRAKDEKAVEHWGVMDVAGMMQQIGVMPVPGAGGG